MKKINLTLFSRLASAVCVFLLIAGAFHWFVNRRYVPEGSSLQLRYRGPVVRSMLGLAKIQDNPGRYAQNGEPGVIEQMPGPGRHFYCPIWWEAKLVPDVVIPPGKLGKVRSNLGNELPDGQFLVDGELAGENRALYKGTLRKMLGPGRYRINPYGYTVEMIDRYVENSGNQVKQSGWLEVPTGYVGVVTNMSQAVEGGPSAGLQSKVLQPGLYFLNPAEQKVDIVEIGYRETSLTVDQVMDGDRVRLDESGEPIPVAQTGIGFPSNDGFPIALDFTAVWGILPQDAPSVVRTFGNIGQAEQKVILPQAESICRINGSKHSAVDLLVGQTRQEFQESTFDQFQKVLQDKHLTLMYGLVRHIYIPQEVRVPIQNGYIADELKLTREQEKVTAETEAGLREAEKKVELEAERVRVETIKVKANRLAEGNREAKEIDAETERQVAAIERQIAELDAKRSITLGEAKATAQKMVEEARSQKFALAVQAFGTGDAFNLWQFADGLPDEIDLRLFYAGQGTLWTDLKSVMPTLPISPPTGTAK